MNKIQGKKTEFAPIREDASRVIISYGYQELDAENGTWLEIYLNKKQISQVSFADVKAAITNDINERITAQIVGGMTFEEKPVWLSIENQINFSQATAPCRLKLGEEEDGTPVYHDFETKAALKAFVDACLAWKDTCLTDGRAEKEAIDWTIYESLFPQAEQSSGE